MEKCYETEKLIIHWKPDVFEVGRKPWIMPENGKEEDIIKVIDKCPSGALSYKFK